MKSKGKSIPWKISLKRCPIIPESQELGKECRHILYGNYRTIFRMEGSRVIIMRVIHGDRLLDLTVIQK